jgi:hypothetical protein
MSNLKFVIQHAVLQIQQAMIQTMFLSQFSMRAAFDDAAVIHYQDLAHIFKTDESMCDQQRGLLLHDIKQCMQHLSFRQ